MRLWIRPAWLLAAGLAAALAGCAETYTKIERDAPADSLLPPPTSGRPVPVLAAGDVLEVYVWGYPDMSRRATVDFSGTIMHPLIGNVPAAGKTVDQVERLVLAGLGEFIREPYVKVSLATARPNKIVVLGEVGRPGVYAMSKPDMRVLEVIAMAGGFSREARQNEVLIIREYDKKVYVHPSDLDKVPGAGNTGENVILAEGDIVYVPVLEMADAARKARRWVDVMAPVLSAQQILLNFMTTTVIWEQFVDALHGTAPNEQTPIIISP